MMKHKPELAICLLPILAMVASCASVEERGQNAEPVLFACDDGENLSVMFANETASVSYAGQEPIVLPQMVTGSGFHYQTPQHSLRGQGDEVLWTIGRRAAIRCTTLSR